MTEPSPRLLVTASAVGAALLTVASFWQGATPYRYRVAPPAVIDLLPQGSPVALVVWYLGLAGVVGAWLALGRRLWRGLPLSVGTVRAAGIAAAAPLLLAAPLASRDLWAYVAQGRIAARGLDPYTVAPADLGTRFAEDISARWVGAVSPYGPLWTVVSRGLGGLTGDHSLVGALVMRLPAALGFVLLACAIPALARRVGASPVTAAWLAVANPLVTVHGVGGGHNDTLMVGLLAVGLLVVVRGSGPRWRALLLGGALIGAGAAIKIPVIVAVPFLPLLWLRYGPGGWERPPSWRAAVRRDAPAVLTGLLWSLGAAVAVLALCTVAAGRGLQWVGAANTAEHGGGPILLGILAATLLGLWLRALRNAQFPMLAGALLAPAMATELSLAWYWTWSLVPAVTFLRGRWALFVVATVSFSAVLYNRPNGVNLGVRPEAGIVIAAVIAWWVLDHRWRPFAADHSPTAVDDAAAPARR